MSAMDVVGMQRGVMDLAQRGGAIACSWKNRARNSSRTSALPPLHADSSEQVQVFSQFPRTPLGQPRFFQIRTPPRRAPTISSAASIPTLGHPRQWHNTPFPSRALLPRRQLRSGIPNKITINSPGRVLAEHPRRHRWATTRPRCHCIFIAHSPSAFASSRLA